MYSTFFELYDFSLGDISSIISLQPALKFNGGGHINHSIFWTNLSPDGGGEPTGEYLYKKGNKKEIKRKTLWIILHGQVSSQKLKTRFHIRLSLLLFDGELTVK